MWLESSYPSLNSTLQPRFNHGGQYYSNGLLWPAVSDIILQFGNLSSRSESGASPETAQMHHNTGHFQRIHAAKRERLSTKTDSVANAHHVDFSRRPKHRSPRWVLYFHVPNDQVVVAQHQTQEHGNPWMKPPENSRPRQGGCCRYLTAVTRLPGDKAKTAHKTELSSSVPQSPLRWRCHFAMTGCWAAAPSRSLDSAMAPSHRP
ncbi:hypothetical protein CPAR01_11511 [Colletotrichum paranaense]|uniref:Uncharacterized protein n=1 Tax=Colletotrichum paranaense TaxID=1914294 RepID=A0ABQ9SBU4_9PEZI|nr:uncharacterized protein CPAR01_11511 [Colletotrichum paranaense]KAK1531862.1 hypothetical protein CPAR01_11511 [Colletotrichum paranaense]